MLKFNHEIISYLIIIIVFIFFITVYRYIYNRYLNRVLNKKRVLMKLPDFKLVALSSLLIVVLSVTTIYSTGRQTNESNHEFIKIDAGLNHYIAMNSNNDIFAWGFNGYGQLGDGTRVDKHTPVKITEKFDLLSSDQIIEVVSGDNHNVALSLKGRVYTWGWNGHGELGDGTLINQYKPYEITNLFNLDRDDQIVYIDESSAVSLTGRVFTWGPDWYGQKGNGKTSTGYNLIDITNQFNYETNDSIIKVVSGDNYKLAVTQSGRLYSWGSYYYGGSTPKDITEHFSLNINERVVDIKVGKDYSVILSSLGRVFTYGINDRYQLGDGTTNRREFTSPYDLTALLELQSNETVDMIGVGTAHTVLVTSSGRVFSWGDNYYGQLGNGTSGPDTYQSKPIDTTEHFNLEEDKRIVELIVKHDQNLMITSTGRIFVWGDSSVGAFGSTPREIIY